MTETLPENSSVGGALGSASGRALAEEAAPLPVRSALDADTERAARSFMKRLQGKYPTIEALVYGSRARGSHSEDSDADIAVVLRGERGDRAAAVIDMAGIAVDVLNETGILIQALPLWESEMNRPDLFGNPALIENIKRDGLRL
jgi:predicted nucleotidyltransferase